MQLQEPPVFTREAFEVLPAATVIIPTLADRHREHGLWRAIHSVDTDQDEPALALVVVNGDRFDPLIVQALAADPRLQLAKIDRPGLPFALRFGRSLVRSRYFGVLDDDDALLPQALAERTAVLDAEPDTDAVVSWGVVADLAGERSEAPLPDPPLALMDQADPLRALLHGNWLHSCGGLFRTATIDEGFFDPEMYHLEWTSVALRIALDRRVRFLQNDTPHFVKYEGTGSLSRSRAYRLGIEQSLAKLLRLELPADVRRALQVRRTDELHHAANYLQSHGEDALSWRYRLRALTARGGLKYLTALRHPLRNRLQRVGRPSARAQG